MLARWLTDLESFEAISRDETMRQVMLRLAAQSRRGGLDGFLTRLELEERIDAGTKAAVTELASDAEFLAAFEEYVRATARLH